MAQEALTRHIQDERLRGELITITRVKISEELDHAELRFTVFREASLPKITKALRAAAPFIQSLVARKVNLRALPRLHFMYDREHAGADHVVGLITELTPGAGVKVEKPGAAPRRPSPPPAGAKSR